MSAVLMMGMLVDMPSDQWVWLVCLVAVVSSTWRLKT